MRNLRKPCWAELMANQVCGADVDQRVRRRRPIVEVGLFYAIVRGDLELPEIRADELGARQLLVTGTLQLTSGRSNRNARRLKALLKAARAREPRPMMMGGPIAGGGGGGGGTLELVEPWRTLVLDPNSRKE